MRHGCYAILLFTASTPMVFAQTLDKAKFRQAIELPAVSTNFAVQFKSFERDARGNKFTPEEKIAALQKKLNGAPDDAEIYLEQRAVYLEVAKDDKKAKEMVAKAEATVRPHLQTNDPKHAFLLTSYGSILESTKESPWAECEKLARRAVAIAPNDWRAWTYLAHVRHQQFPALACGYDTSKLPKENRTQEILGMLYLQRCKAEHVADAEKALNEALQYHDKARDLAPNEPKRQLQRYGFRLTEIVLRNAIAAYRGQKPPFPMQQIERVVLDELESAARLHPDHVLWQSQFAHQLMILGWQQEPEKGKKLRTFRPAREEDAKAIREALGRIEKLADSAKGETAVYCYVMLTALYSTMQDNASVEKHARKVLQIEPADQLAGEQLQQALVLQGKHVEQLEAAQKLVAAKASARNCYLLAKALGFNQRYDLAEQAIQAGLKQDPDDAYCLMGRAALMMRKADDAETLRSAGELLDKARRVFRADAGPLVFAEIEYMSALHNALSGDVALARLKLQHMQRENPENGRYEKLLSAFSR